jgi:Phosphate transporter family
VIGATFVASGSDAVEGEGILSKVIVPAVLSPIVAGLVAALGVFLVYRIIKRFVIDRAERQFRWAQVASSSMVALAHGTNDAQKTMGVISLALIANGNIAGGENFDVPTWVIVSCATAIALGTYAGGWRIIKTLGTKVVEVRPPQGFGSEAVAATVILASYRRQPDPRHRLLVLVAGEPQTGGAARGDDLRAPDVRRGARSPGAGGRVMTLASIVDWGSLLEAVYISVAVGLGVLIVAGIAVATSLSAEDARTVGNGGATFAFGAVTVLCVLALIGSIVAGVYLLTQ